MKSKPLVIGDLIAKIPVIQGGMGVGISLSGLAGAVAAAGGIGVISTAQIGFRDPGFDEHPIETNLKAIDREVKKAKELAKRGIIGVNIMMATKCYEDYVAAAVKAGVDLIITGAGLPTNLPKLVEQTKTKIAPIISSLKAAKVICKLWDRNYQRVPDLVVIEGPKAGGHLGFTKEEVETIDEQTYDKEIGSILSFVKEHGEEHQTVIPVVVAGGIYDRADMEKYIGMGAAGVQIGTRFVTTYECDAPMEFKQVYLNAQKEQIKIIKSPVGMPGRAVETSFIRQSGNKKPNIKKCHQCLTHCNPSEIPYCITDALVAAAKGQVDDGLVFCGENAWRTNKLEHVEDIMKEFS